jgi:hypothetical protein
VHAYNHHRPRQHQVEGVLRPAAVRGRVDGAGPITWNHSLQHPNTFRVAYYSAAISAPNYNQFQTMVFKVSWRDDRGTAHYVDWTPIPPGALESPVWSA